jgi:hypothetical protein
MSKLITLNDIIDTSLIDDILNNELTIFEDIQGSKIYVNFGKDSIEIKPKSLKSNSLNILDLAIQKYYNKAIDYLSTLEPRVISLIDKKWWFCFEYFPDEQPANIEYTRTPKHNLVLASIYKGEKFDYSVEELDEYARLLDVDVIPVIFKGKLNDGAQEAIKYFLNTNEDDLDYVFGESSFAYFFYKLLNPSLTNSFLMDDFQKNIQKLVIRIDNKDISFEILNPLYRRITDQNVTDFADVYTLILVNFLTFAQSIDFDKLKISGQTREDVYINIICKLYNLYITEVKEDLLNFDFIVPDFFDKDKFRINTELISNKMTKEYISESKKLEYILKVVLGSFKVKRKTTKTIGVFTESTIIIFNLFVDKISNMIDTALLKGNETELINKGLLNFEDFFDIKIDKDGADNVYPDVFDEILGKNNNDKKKKGMKTSPLDYTKKDIDEL